MKSYVVCFYSDDTYDMSVLTLDQYQNSSKPWQRAINIQAKNKIHAAYLAGRTDE